jgi:hypothetical protein
MRKKVRAYSESVYLAQGSLRVTLQAINFLAGFLKLDKGLGIRVSEPQQVFVCFIQLRSESFIFEF